MKQRCGTCRHFEGQPFPSKPGWRRLAGRCRYEVQMPPLPDVLTRGHGSKSLADLNSLKSAAWPDDGETCPCWEAADAV